MENNSTPILFPYEPEQFWQQMQQLIREEIAHYDKTKINTVVSELIQTPGMTQKPLYKINEVCSLFGVTKPTVYDWIKHGKLRPFKMRSRLYFLGNEINTLLSS